jgi:hypothetical protein
MSLRSLVNQSALLRERIALRHADSGGSFGHAHFWQRAALSRRNFIRAGATLAAGIAVPPILWSAPETSLPKPIPGGLDLLGNGQIFHVYLPGTAPELATITDFNGVLGATEVLGTWSGGGITPPPSGPLAFDADMRFMTGEYIGRDERHHQGTFAFV